MGYQQLSVQLLLPFLAGDALPASMIIVITTAVVITAILIAQTNTAHAHVYVKISMVCNKVNV